MTLVEYKIAITVDLEEKPTKKEDLDEIGQFLAEDFYNMLENGEDFVEIRYIGADFVENL